MKKLVLGISFFVSLFAIRQASAQVRVNVNINIGSQPNWGPVGYDYVEYYYLPDIETYYYVPTRQFIYLSGRNWVFSYGLPPVYRAYNLYSGYKVVINQPRAYQYFHTHKVKYVGYKGNRGQVIIKNSNDPKYKAHKVKSSGHGNGNGNGRGRGRGNH